MSTLNFEVIASNVKDQLHSQKNGTEVYFRAYDNLLYVAEYDGSSWSQRCLNPSIPKVSNAFYDIAWGKIYFQAIDDRKLHNLYKSGGNWLHGTVCPSANNIKYLKYHRKSRKLYYIGWDSKIYNYYYSNDWKHFPLNPSVNNAAKDLILGDGELFYRDTDNRLCILEWKNNQWEQSEMKHVHDSPDREKIYFVTKSSPKALKCYGKEDDLYKSLGPKFPLDYQMTRIYTGDSEIDFSRGHQVLESKLSKRIYYIDYSKFIPGVGTQPQLAYFDWTAANGWQHIVANSNHHIIGHLMFNDDESKLFCTTAHGSDRKLLCVT